MKTYEERRNESAENYANSMLPDNEDAHSHPTVLAVGICSENGFIRGSDFGRADAIKEICEWMRSHEAREVGSMMHDGENWADVTEHKFGVNSAKL